MNVLDVFDRCLAEWAVLSRQGDGLHAEPLDHEHPLSPELVKLLRAHKPELLTLLDYQEKADALLLESTKRLAAEWPVGCPLDTTTWEALEEGLTAAYWTEDEPTLRAALAERDTYALEVFHAYREEVLHEPTS